MHPNGFKMSDRDFWNEQFRLQELSGLTQIDYCKKHGFKVETFKYAKSRLVGAAKNLTGNRILVPVKTISDSNNTNLPIVIVTAKGTKIECSTSTDAQWLGTVLSKLNA